MTRRIPLAAASIIGIVVLLTSLLAIDLKQSYMREIESAEAATISIASILETGTAASSKLKCNSD